MIFAVVKLSNLSNKGNPVLFEVVKLSMYSAMDMTFNSLFVIPGLFGSSFILPYVVALRDGSFKSFITSSRESCHLLLSLLKFSLKVSRLSISAFFIPGIIFISRVFALPRSFKKSSGPFMFLLFKT